MLCYECGNKVTVGQEECPTYHVSMWAISPGEPTAMDATHQSADSPLLVILILLMGVWWFFRRLGVFQGFWTGFWSGFFTRLFVGTLRTPTGSGLLEKLITLVIVVVVLLLLLAWLASTGS